MCPLCLYVIDLFTLDLGLRQSFSSPLTSPRKSKYYENLLELYQTAINQHEKMYAFDKHYVHMIHPKVFLISFKLIFFSVN